MICEKDYEVITSMVGDGNLSETMKKDLEREYMKVLRLCHRGGRSGALGIEMCAVVLRNCRINPPQSPTATDNDSGVDWRQVELGQRVKVDKGGRKLIGKFAGMVTGGTIAVSLDGHDVVQECSPRDCGVLDADIPADIDMNSVKVESGDDGPDVARLQAIEDSERDQKMVDLLKETTGEEEIIPEDEEEASVLGDELSSYDTGDPISYMSNGKVKDAVFLRDGPKKDQITIWHDDKESHINRSRVTSVQTQEPVEA